MKKIRMSLGVQISILALSSSIVVGLILFIFIKEEFLPGRLQDYDGFAISTVLYPLLILFPVSCKLG